jgi:biotin operon repressor
VAEALRDAATPCSAAEIAGQLGIARATAQRYLAALAQEGAVDMNLRYGTAGRPEHLLHLDRTAAARSCKRRRVDGHLNGRGQDCPGLLGRSDRRHSKKCPAGVLLLGRDTLGVTRANVGEHAAEARDGAARVDQRVRAGHVAETGFSNDRGRHSRHPQRPTIGAEARPGCCVAAA